MLGEYFPNRTLCTVLSEMRKCHETRNYSYLPGLIEEAQMMGNRMESALYDRKDLDAARKELRKVRDELSKVKEETSND